MKTLKTWEGLVHGCFGWYKWCFHGEIVKLRERMRSQSQKTAVWRLYAVVGINVVDFKIPIRT